MSDLSGKRTVIRSLSGGSKIEERLAVSTRKTGMRKLGVKRFSLKKPNDVEGKGK
jgi:hypothetical protein